MVDILIHMEMPQRCRDCCFAGFVFTCHLAGKTHDDVLRTRPDWCPLIPLPAGHGRLIDAEAYVDYMQNRYDNNEITNGDWIDFRLSLKDQPTIVPAEGGTEDA